MTLSGGLCLGVGEERPTDAGAAVRLQHPDQLIVREFRPQALQAEPADGLAHACGDEGIALRNLPPHGRIREVSVLRAEGGSVGCSREDRRP